MSFVTGIADRLAGLPPAAIYAVAGLLLAAEVGLLIGLAVPAASIMLALGALAATDRIDLTTAIAVATASAAAGDSIGYWEGRLTGPRLRTSRLARRIGADRWHRAERMLRRGAPAIVLGRWTAYARTLVPRLAGAAGIRYRTFLLYNLPAVVVWIPASVLLGYLGLTFW